MNLQQYHDLHKTKAGRVYSQHRAALVITEGRKWMTLLVVRDGRLVQIRRPMTEQRYMTPLHGDTRKLKATLRRLSRKRGTPKQIRAALAVGLEVET